MPLCTVEDWKDYLNQNVTAYLTKRVVYVHISVSHFTSNTQSTKHIELSGLHLGHCSLTLF